MSREQPLTSPEAIDDVVERYAVTEAQAHLLVAKTAVAKLVATVADDEMFVLKGGTLLHHVHGSPRVSLADIDYADGRKKVSADVAAVKDAIRAEHDLGFQMDVDAGAWNQKGGLISGEEIPVFLTIDASGGHPVNISVAVRQGEVIDMEVVEFHPVGLVDRTVFRVQAVSLGADDHPLRPSARGRQQRAQRGARTAAASTRRDSPLATGFIRVLPGLQSIT